MPLPKPEWLKVKSQANVNNLQVENMLKGRCLNTVCEQANCPNINECFSKRTVTFMILGKTCTRNCTFCTVGKGEPQPLDKNEPEMTAQAVKELNLRHVVITSVTRDDLPDGGAVHYVKVIEAVRKENPDVTIEILIPDFKGDPSALKKVIDVKPEVINHNIETVPRLYPAVRPMAVFERSIELLKRVKRSDGTIYTKSGIMLGLGETEDEVIEAFAALREVGCDLLTIGQYLAPSKLHHPVVKYIHPDMFERYRETALGMGFVHVVSGTFVRSSYHAKDAFEVVKG